MLLTETTQLDYDGLCHLDVLGLADSPTRDPAAVYTEFKEQLRRDRAGWYETGLPWRGNHPPLPNNEKCTIRRIHSLQNKLKPENLTDEYDAIIQEQLKQGIVERDPDTATTKEFYIPHKAVVKKTAETTKTRIVYDASAKASPDVPYQNECLKEGPSLMGHPCETKSLSSGCNRRPNESLPSDKDPRMRKRCLTFPLAA